MKMKLWMLLLVALSAISSHFAYSEDSDGIQKIDRIIALVDQTVITEKELNDRINSLMGELKKQQIEIPPMEVLQKQMLERMIVEKLQIAFAQQSGLKVDDAQLDRTIERIAEQNKLDVPEFKKALAKEGISFRKFREDLRNEILISRLKEREIESKLNVTDAEIDNYLSLQNKEEKTDEFNISHIMIRTPEDASPSKLAELRQKADKVLQELQSGKDFAQVSASYSDAPNAIEGGALGWKSITQMPSLFADAVRNLKAGDITVVLRSANGFHILKVNERRGGSSPLVVTQYHTRHILIKVNEITSEKEARQRLDGIRVRAENGEDFGTLAKQFSEDSSASKGGDLGWLNAKENLPELDKVMETLAVGEVSQPIKTQFGLHLLQVTEQRQQDMSQESSKMKARQEIRARKSDEAYQDWIRELRDRAFVEIRLEDKF
jgi:peptidyl-prolyl cis-trans isomerase SurA